MKSCKEIW